MRLSVLDQSPACAGVGEDESVRRSLALAEHAEALGYERYWASEHHNLPAIVGTAPEVLLAAVAARTRRIRIGSAGVMLPHYSPLKVAEQFRMLDALAPGRVDLGVGRAPGGDMRTAAALNPNAMHAAEAFPEAVADLARRLGRGDGADVVVETSGNPAAFAEGLALARTRGRYLVPGQYSNRGTIAIAPQTVTFKALRIIGSAQYQLTDIGTYLDFLEANPGLQPLFRSALACYPIEAVNTALADAAAGKAIKAAIRPAGAENAGRAPGAR